MTDDRPDSDLAPVTDLFGARSRRRPSGAPSDGSTDGSADASTEGNADSPFPLEMTAGRPDADLARPDLPTIGPASADDDDVDWLPPVTGASEGDAAAAAESGYGPTADAAVASVFSIVDGDEIDPADAPRPLADQRADAERISMRGLGRRGMSVSEMRTLLLGRELDADVVEQELDRLLGVGLLDDAALASELIDRLHSRKHLGRQGVLSELRRRGIDPIVIDAALTVSESDDQGDDDAARATELAVKRATQLRGLDRTTAERRLSGFLMRKGYGSSIVREAVRRALDGTGPRGSVRFD